MSVTFLSFSKSAVVTRGSFSVTYNTTVTRALRDKLENTFYTLQRISGATLRFYSYTFTALTATPNAINFWLQDKFRGGAFTWKIRAQLVLQGHFVASYRKKLPRQSRNCTLKGHCHGNFAIFWSKPLKYLIKSLFF